jgi:hypothetical protein
VTRKPDKTGRSERHEHWTKMLRATMETPAWRALSTTAQALYPWIKLEWKGPEANNNGTLSLSVSQAAERLGVTPDTASRAFHDLQAKGFIVLTQEARLGIEGAAKRSTFEITEIGLRGDSANPRRLYLKWTPERPHPIRKCAKANPRGVNGGQEKGKSHHDNQDGTIMKIETIQKRLS